MARYPGVAAASDVAILGEAAGQMAGLLRWRAFETVGLSETWVLAEYDRPVRIDRTLDAFAALGQAGARMANVYAPYWRAPT